MSVIGIDFGNESCYVAVAKGGGIETVDNDYSLRATSSTVAFGQNQRILGVAAKNQLVTNIKNTVWGFKRFLGRKFDDPYVQEEIKHLPFQVVRHEPTGGVAVQVTYMGEPHVFTVEQIAAMLFTKLKDSTEQGLKTKISDCVISVPSFFTDVERKALRVVAETAGFKILRLLNETAATSLTYGIYKQDLPEAGEKPRNVVFVDCGHSSLQVWVCAFNKGQLKILASTADPFLGGRNFDKVLADYFCEEFRKKYKIDPETNHRAYIRLLTEVEKLKKQMSANATKLPLNIECLMNDMDVTSSMNRADFEAMSQSLFQRVEATLIACLKASELKVDEIYSIEIVGGSTRIPAIKAMIEKTFGKTPSTTLNQDEAVARGCALQCAILSPAYKVRDFKITDAQPYPIRIVWDETLQEDGYLEVFPLYHPIPYSRILTFYKQSDFNFKAVYAASIPYPSKEIASYHIKNIKAPEGDTVKIKIKARVNMDGVFSICNVTAYERCAEEPMETDQATQESAKTENGPDPKEEKMETQPAANGEVPQAEGQNQQTMDTDTTQSPDATSNGQNQSNDNADMDVEAGQDGIQKDEKKKEKSVYKTVEIPFEIEGPGLTLNDLQWMTEKEGKMVAEDKKEKERIDAKNGLEEFVYVLRDKLEQELAEFVQEHEKTQLINELSLVENWLYEDGSDENRQVYVDRLEHVQKMAGPVFERQREKLEKERLARELLEKEAKERLEKEKQEREKLEGKQSEPPQPADGQAPPGPAQDGSNNPENMTPNNPESLTTEDL